MDSEEIACGHNEATTEVAARFVDQSLDRTLLLLDFILGVQRRSVREARRAAASHVRCFASVLPRRTKAAEERVGRGGHAFKQKGDEVQRVTNRVVSC